MDFYNHLWLFHLTYIFSTVTEYQKNVKQNKKVYDYNKYYY